MYPIMTDKLPKSTPKMQKSEKSFVVHVAVLQRLAQNRLGPFFLTTWPSTTYKISFADTKKPPKWGA